MNYMPFGGMIPERSARLSYANVNMTSYHVPWMTGFFLFIKFFKNVLEKGRLRQRSEVFTI